VPGGGLRVSRTGAAIFFVAVLGVAAAIVWWRHGTEDARSDTGSTLMQHQTAETGHTVVLDPQTPQAPQLDKASPDLVTDFAARFRESPDYLEYVRSLLGPARAGNHAAQFYIFRALDKCKYEFSLYFGARIRQSLDDALRSAAEKGWPFDPEEVRRVHGRCSGLMESDVKELGDRNEWLALATAGKHPLAQVYFARFLSMEARKSDNDDAAGRETRKLLLAEALRSREPEVIFEIGNSSYVTVASDGEAAWGEYAWVLAACLRGLDCAPQSDIARTLCLYDRACQPYESVPDIIRRGNETEFPAWEDKAHWINEKIDAGDWAALGF